MVYITRSNGENIMILLISIVLAILPAFLLVIYFYRKDSLKREPKGMIVRAFSRCGVDCAGSSDRAWH